MRIGYLRISKSLQTPLWSYVRSLCQSSVLQAWVTQALLRPNSCQPSKGLSSHAHGNWQTMKRHIFSPVAWHTKQIGRVVRSALSGEAYAMSSSLDKLTWIRCMWGYIKDPSFAWHKPEKSLCAEPPGLMITDGKFLKDLVIKTAVPNCQEWRATIEVMLLKYRQIIPNAAGSALLPCWQAVWRSPWTQPFYAQFCSWEYSESMMKKWPSNRTRTGSMVLHGWSNRTLKIDQCEFSNLSLLNAPSIVSCQGKHIHHVPFDSWLKANFSERGVKISSAAIGLSVWWRVDSLGFGWIDIYIFGVVANTPVIHINYILVNKKDLVSIFRWERLPVELGSDPTTYIYNDIYIYL